MTHTKLLGSMALVALLGACAGPVADSAFQDIAAKSEQKIGKRPVWIKSEDEEKAVRHSLDQLLTKPLSADDAVQVALLNNRRLQSDLAELGIGAADLTSAWRPGNPGLTFSRLQRSGAQEIDRTFSIDALSVILLPITAGIEQHRFEQTKLKTANAILSLAARTKRAWYQAVAAEQTAKYVEQVQESAEVQAELVRRMRQAGNWSVLDYAREQLFYADATARLAKSRLAAAAAREKLARLMGLWGGDLAFKLPERLPDLPQQPREIGNVEAVAISDRLDVQMAKAGVGELQRAYGLTNATRFINVLEVGYVRNSESGLSNQTGYELRLEVPLFDFGDAKATKAESLYMQAVNQLADIAVNARSTAREAYIGYRTAFDLAQHYRNDIIPLRQKIAEEAALRYSGMQISVFELLADSRDQIADVSNALEAQRDFWIADTDLSFVTLAAIGANGSAD